ncbi:MAG: FtsX-like permease family protein [Saprospiraceae bacterium]|nr:FtsX-like permease family protein [Saprospiraceae bacterium]
MLQNYFKIAFRNLLRYKIFSLVNLFGLTIGLACCLLIALFILDELSYDRYHDKADRIYRVTRSFLERDGSVQLHLGHVAPPFGPLIKNDFQDVEEVARLLQNTTNFRYEDKVFTEQNVFMAEENLFKIFSVDVLKGNPDKALVDPFTVMVSDEMAKKYFGDEDPMDKVMQVDGQFTAKVSGVFKKFPSNSHWHPDFLVSFSTLRDTSIYGEEGLRTNWGNNSFSTYLLLPKDYDTKKLEVQFPAFLDRHMGAEARENDYPMPSTWTKLYLNKMTDIHLYSHLDSEIETNGDIKRVYIFAAIALLILLIAAINYMNLATARSATRAKEIGIRKVAGAQQGELMRQFLSESLLMTLLAMILAVGVTWFCLPMLESLTGKDLTIQSILNWRFAALAAGVTALVGLLSGIYPAVFMASFQPIAVLKGIFKIGGGNVSLRKVLVVAQFSISIILISCTGIVFQQLQYMQGKSLGFDKEHVITLPYYGNLGERWEAFRNELLSNRYIINVGRSLLAPSDRLLNSMGTATVPMGDSTINSSETLNMVFADHDFFPTYGIPFVGGRNFSRDFPTDDSTAFIINETAMRMIGWQNPEDGIGKSFEYGGRKGRLVGIVKDFNFESLHFNINPIVFFIPTGGNRFSDTSIKIDGNNIQNALSHIEKTWRQFIPDFPYQYTFVDESFGELYEAEQRQGRLFTIFSGIAIFIACLGLFGLAAFATAQRVREIGIRKVLGASVGNIVTLISKDFLWLVLIAAVIAVPVAWYAMSNWLADFAYRINLPWWMFAVAGIIALLVALGTVSMQAIRAAVANPVESLRSE